MNIKRWWYNLLGRPYIAYAGKNGYYVVRRGDAYDPRECYWWKNEDYKKNNCRLDLDTAKEVLEDVKKMGKITS